MVKSRRNSLRLISYSSDNAVLYIQLLTL